MLDTSYIVNVVKKLSSNTQKEVINTLDQDNEFYKMIIDGVNEKLQIYYYFFFNIKAAFLAD